MSSALPIPGHLRAILFDLDGTVYHGSQAIPGAAKFIRDMQSRDVQCMFVTNRSNRAAAEVAAQLCDMGIATDASMVITSAYAAAVAIAPTSIYCIGEEGLRAALKEHGHTLVDDAPTHVVVGLDRQFNYNTLTQALGHVAQGAKLVATNADSAITTESGMVPENGPLVAAIEAATGEKATVVGKPSAALFDAALKRLGVGKPEALVVGDNIATDILGGCRAQIATVLLLTGVTTQEQLETSSIKPSAFVKDYDELARLLERRDKKVFPS